MPDLISIKNCDHGLCSLVACYTRYWILNQKDIEKLSSRWWIRSRRDYGHLDKIIAEYVTKNYSFYPGEHRYQDQIEQIVKLSEDNIGRHFRPKTKFFRKNSNHG